MLRDDRGTRLPADSPARNCGQGGGMPRHPRPRVPEWALPWIESFTLHLESAGRSPLTVERYTDSIGWLAGWLATDSPTLHDWHETDHKHIRRFLLHLQDAGYSRKYVHNIGGALQQYWRWFAAEEDAPNPMSKVAVPAAPKLGETPPPVIAQEQLSLLLKDAESGRDFESRRDAALIRLFAGTGGRLAEIASLTLDDLAVSKREATVTGKGGKTRTVRYDHRCAVAIDRYLRVRARHKAVVECGATALWVGVRRRGAMTPSGIRQAIERRGARLGIRLWPHLFRHTFAHRWLDAGGAEGDLEELAGWESPQMLRHYGRSARSARARRAYDRVDVMGGV